MTVAKFPIVFTFYYFLLLDCLLVNLCLSFLFSCFLGSSLSRQNLLWFIKCFKFYWKVFWFKLLSVFYNILQGTKYLWNTVAVSFLPKFIAGCFELGKKMRPDVFQRHYTLCDGVLVCILFSRSLVLLIFNFFSRLLF